MEKVNIIQNFYLPTDNLKKLAASYSLPFIQFEILQKSLADLSLDSKEGTFLRKIICENGVLKLLFDCLKIYTHHDSYKFPEKDDLSTSMISLALDTEKTAVNDKKDGFWVRASDVGFAGRRTQKSRNIEGILSQKKYEDDNISVIFLLLSSFVNPGCESSAKNYEFSAVFIDLVYNSCLLPVLCLYLKNDSILDISKNMSFYHAIIKLLQAFATSTQLRKFLTFKPDDNSKLSITDLFYNMKSCIEKYDNRLKKQTSYEIVDEELALLVQDIQKTAKLLQKSRKSYEKIGRALLPKSDKSIEEMYLIAMKELQFSMFDIADEHFQLVVPYNNMPTQRMIGERPNPQRIKRLSQEIAILEKCLPLSLNSSIFIRCDSDRIDLMKVLITGPCNTPYSNGCFEFDVYFPPDYPNSPMIMNLKTTGLQSVRFNPNLYNDGFACLSILNTWAGRQEEMWNSETSSLLKVLVSIQSLVLNSEPFYNEPGFERIRGTACGNHQSKEYNKNIYSQCVKWAMLEQILHPSPCFEDVIYKHFWFKRDEICQQIETWIDELDESVETCIGCKRDLQKFDSTFLKQTYAYLKNEFSKLSVP